MTNVLLVDDEAYILSSVTKSVPWAENGLQVFCAGDGEEAYAMLASRSIDIMLTDIQMPKMDGLTLLEKLESEDRDLEIVMLSCYNEFELVRKAMTLGATDYLFKPTMYPRDILAAVLKARERLEKRRVDVRHFGDVLEGKRMETPAERAWLLALNDELRQGRRVLVLQIADAADVLMERFGDNSHQMARHLGQCLKAALGTEHVHARGCESYVALVKDIRDAIAAFNAENELRSFGGLSREITDDAQLRDAYKEADARARQARLENVPLKDDESASDYRMEEIAKYMGEHLADVNLSLPAMAERAGMSKTAFANRFKEQMGENFLTSLTRMRVQKAKELYCNTEMKIYEIAEAVGYSDWHYLYHVYKKYVGHSLSREKRRP